MRYKMAILVLAGSLALPLAGCRVTQTEEGEMPEVDVDVEEGQLPAYDVDAADVDVETGETEITVPTVDVDVTPPGDPDYEEEKEDQPPVE